MPGPYVPTGWVNNTVPPINATNLNHIEAGIQTAQADVDAVPGKFGRVWLDDFAGADHDAKLTAALTAVAADTYPRAIQLKNQQYTFATINRQPFNSMRIIGPEGISNPELNSQQKMPCRVHLTGAGPWFLHASATSVRSTMFANLPLTGTGSPSAAYLCGSATANDLWRDCQWHAIDAYNLKHVCGSQASAIRLTACSFTGRRWDVNGLFGGGFHLAGSDNFLWLDGGLLIDSPPDRAVTGGANGQFHVWFDFCDFSTIGPIYATCESGWGGIKVSGPSNVLTSTGNNQGRVVGTGWTVTGRNPTQPCWGSTIRVEGGFLKVVGGEIKWGMSSPASMGHSPTDAGVVHQSGGILQLDGMMYDRTNGQAEDVPFVYSSAGRCIVKNTVHTSRGGTWAGLPRVDQAGGTVDADGYVTLI